MLYDMLHLSGFTPVWNLKCALKLLSLIESFWHMLHTIGFNHRTLVKVYKKEIYDYVLYDISYTEMAFYQFEFISLGWVFYMQIFSEIAFSHYADES